MKTAVAFLALLSWAALAAGDTLLLKDGTTIEWVSLRNNGDTYDVQTADGKALIIQKKDVQEIKPKVLAAPLTGATFTGDVSTKDTAPVNLFSLIDLKRDVAAGQWKLQSGALVATGAPAALLEIPQTPPEEYDVEIVAERLDGDGDLQIGLYAQGKRFSVDVDGPGAASGVRMIDGRYPYENESGVQTKIWPDKKQHKIVCAVRKERVVLVIDGKELMNWKADYNKVSVSNTPGPGDKKNTLFLAAANGTFKLLRMVLIPRK